MEDKILRNKIESLLFLWGEPLDLSSISEAIKLNKKDTRKLLNDLTKEYEFRNTSLEIRCVNDNYQIQTKKDYHEFLKEIFTKNKNTKLTNTTMEVLSIIAYKQPITRIEIDEIRGVKSSSSIDTLIKKNLIKEVGRLDKIGKPILFGTTDEFLYYFNINSINELPKLNEIEKLIKERENEDK
ncbi:SMC-Scp complex subunit ScpB [uncultured Finegoldia sp.]|uniref:SMC-Scp complex subunit ScpB n=1 Tax=uncultured Finegoldia sp. TaxID=328009 RepID=UPI0026379966|nr:SMC-Scp complex subunit ScpB [uncultured Finegoldia sp.]